MSGDEPLESNQSNDSAGSQNTKLFKCLTQIKKQSPIPCKANAVTWIENVSVEVLVIALEKGKTIL